MLTDTIFLPPDYVIVPDPSNQCFRSGGFINNGPPGSGSLLFYQILKEISDKVQNFRNVMIKHSFDNLFFSAHKNLPVGS